MNSMFAGVRNHSIRWKGHAIPNSVTIDVLGRSKGQISCRKCSDLIFDFDYESPGGKSSTPVKASSFSSS
jgi:hypothetical protein